MKTNFLLIALFMLPISYLFGKIRNGYEGKLQQTMDSLQYFRSRLHDEVGFSNEEKRGIRAKVKDLVEYISCYELTDALIAQVKLLSPDLFNRMDSIRDKKNRITDIFVKVISKERAIIQLEGTSSFTHSPLDEDSNSSEYGDHSVSVNVWIGQYSLQLLYHELGHMSYVVPNVGVYYKFYKKHYPMPVTLIASVGHHAKDLSGRAARAFERQCKEDRGRYIQTSSERVLSAIAVMNKIRRNNSELEIPAMNEVWYTRRLAVD